MIVGLIVRRAAPRGGDGKSEVKYEKQGRLVIRRNQECVEGRVGRSHPPCEKEYTDKGPSLILGASTINVVRPMKDIL